MIKQLHQKLENKEISAQQLTKDFLYSIEKKNDELNVFLEVFKKEALLEAERVDEKLAKGEKLEMLEGIPCAVKDNICLAGRKVSAASKILENYVAPYDAGVIEKLKKVGAVFLGRTNMDEFAMGSSTENSAFGPTKNPFDFERVPGGSSGGSAAAVAADLAVWALGSDTGGSIRQPASFCGLVGLKPTYGRVSRRGLLAMASSYDQIGPLTKSVEDAAIVLETLAGRDEADNTSVSTKEKFFQNLKPELRGKKIGIVKDFFAEGLDSSVENLLQKKLAFAKEQGAILEEIDLPYLKYSMAVYYLMITAEVSSNLARFDGVRYGFSESVLEKSLSQNLQEGYFNSRGQGFGAEVQRRIILGTYCLSAGYYDAYYKKAQKIRQLIKKDFQKAFSKVDVIFSPTTPTPAFRLGEKKTDPLQMYLSDIYTVSANVAMLPAISLPSGNVEKEGKKLPVGLQLLGKWWDEQLLLNVALALENK